MDRENTVQIRQSIRTRLLVLILGLVFLSIVVIAYASVNSILRAGQNAQTTGNTILRQRAEQNLIQITTSNAETFAATFEDVRLDADHIAQFMAQIYSAPDDYNRQTFWRADEKMFLGSDNQYINGETDISTVFVPNVIEVNDNLKRNVELSAYLDSLIPAIYDSNPDSVAIYLIHKDDFTRLYPNINLGLIIPPDFQATEDVFFTTGSPENNPERLVQWTPVYEDPAGQGLLVTAVAPIYTTENEFIGIIGIDLSLNAIAETIEDTAPVAGGYTFMIDEDGTAIALPAGGHQDILGTSLPEGISGTGTNLSQTGGPFAPVLANMQNGETGFQSIVVSDEELFVSYAPLPETNWSIASVVAADTTLQLAADLQGEIQTSTQSLVTTRIIPISIGILVLAVMVGLALTNRMVAPLQNLATTAQQIGAGQWEQTSAIAPESNRTDEIGVLAKALTNMTDQLKELFDSLEQRVADRTRALEISGNVSRQLSNILERQELVKAVVDQVQTAFDYYHTHIYLFDDAAENLIMVGGTGEAGQQMLANKHQIAAGKGLVGRAGQTGQPVLVPDTAQAEDWLPNPLLPETKAEIAVPIMSGDKVWGVLDVQHNVTDGLTQADVDLLESVANQVAVALRNANLFEEAQQQAQREALMNEINQKILNTKDINEAMQVAVREIGHALNASQTIVRFTQADSGKGFGDTKPLHSGNGND